MLATLSGTVTHVGGLWCVVEVAGVGYRVYATPTTLAGLSLGVPVTLWVHHAVREDAEDLFGFETLDELLLFELLISVSGIGPRSGLGLLGLADVSTLAGAIARGDADYLTRVSGVGKKTAQKVVLELKDKVAGFATADTNTDDADVIEALIEMGYTRAHAREAIKTIPESTHGVPARLKAALAQRTS